MDMIGPGQRWRPWKGKKYRNHPRPILVTPLDRKYSCPILRDKIPTEKYRQSEMQLNCRIEHEMNISITWLNSVMEWNKKKLVHVEDIVKCIQDGITIVQVLEILDGVKLQNICRRPILKSQKIHNIETCFKYFHKRGISISEDQRQQIGAGNRRTIVLFLRSLQETFSVTQGSKVAKGAINLRSKDCCQRNLPEIPQKNNVTSYRATSGWFARKNGRKRLKYSFSGLWKKSDETMSLGRYSKKVYSANNNYTMTHVSPDGRRQIFGLTKAIRKHAFQSTSPSSEFKSGRQRYKSQENMDNCKITNKSPPTIEERLRNLLNSDTEGADGQSTSKSKKWNCDKPPTYELGSKGSQGSYSPRTAESKVNRTTSDEPADMSRLWNGVNRTRSSSIDRDEPRNGSCTPSQMSSKSPVPFARRQKTEALSARQRRCVSAIPTSFHDENWNVVPDHPKDQQSLPRDCRTPQMTEKPCSPGISPGRKTPTSLYNHAVWNQRPPPSPSRTATLPQEASSSSEKEAPPSWMALRSNNERKNNNSNGSARKTLEYTLSNLPVSSKDNRQEKASDPPRSFFRFRRPAPIPPSQASVSNDPQCKSTTELKTGNTVERKSKAIQYLQPPSPARRKSLENKIESIDVEVNQGDRNSTNPVPTQRKDARPREEVITVARKVSHKTPNVEIIDLKKVVSSQPLDDELASRKSEDRDSGAILDAEPSVFDFDSSVLSESDDGDTQASPKKVDNSSTAKEENVWSRSSTPTLPPLSPYESEDETPRNSEPNTINLVKNEAIINYQNEVARLPSYENLLKKRISTSPDSTARQKPEADNVRYSGGENQSHDHHELSPTESALAESRDTHKKTISGPPVKVVSKVISSKVSRGPKVTRHGSRASSNDERNSIPFHGRQQHVVRRHKHHKSRKHHREEYFDDNVHVEGSGSAVKQNHKLGRYPVFYRPSSEEALLEQDAVVETSSVRSFTTASVTSSVIRKSKRHHRRHHGHSGILDKAYTKEVKAVNKRFSRLEAHVVTLARSVAQLSSEMRRRNSTSRDIEDIRGQIEQIRREKSEASDPLSRKSSSSRSKSEVPRATLNSKSQPRRVVKLTKFFGEQPPILNLFLTQLGYEKYIDNFKSESIGMIELPYMDEERLKSIGIPLGPRMRILNEAKKTTFV